VPDKTRFSITVFPGDQHDIFARESFADSVKLRLQRQNRRRRLKESGANEARQRAAKEGRLTAREIADRLRQKGQRPTAQRVRYAWPDKDNKPSRSTISRWLAKE
jgi:hypothetical protein